MLAKLSSLGLLLGLSAVAAAAGPAKCPHCQSEQQLVYRNVISHRCRIVPEKRQIKKTVYEVKEVPYCLHKLPPLLGSHHRCEDCPECECPRYKKVLMKKEVVCEEVCGTKCVVEEFVERVPCLPPCCPHCSPASHAVPKAPELADQEIVPFPPPVLAR